MKKTTMQELVNIQGRLKAPKGQYNKFGGYRYRSCEDILEAVKPLLQEFGCALYISDHIINLGDRFYIEATATIENGEGKTITARGYAREEETKKGMDAAQITGSASSYARKYALNGLFCIDDTKDPDSNEQAEQGNAASNNPTPAPINAASNNSTPTPAPVSTGMTLFPAAKLDDPVTVDALCRWLDKKLAENPKATPAGILEVKYIIDRDVLVRAVNTYYEWKANNNQQ